MVVNNILGVKLDFDEYKYVQLHVHTKLYLQKRVNSFAQTNWGQCTHSQTPVIISKETVKERRVPIGRKSIFLDNKVNTSCFTILCIKISQLFGIGVKLLT